MDALHQEEGMEVLGVIGEKVSRWMKQINEEEREAKCRWEIKYAECDQNIYKEQCIMKEKIKQVEQEWKILGEEKRNNERTAMDICKERKNRQVEAVEEGTD